jgi:CheY-like chemotaxis protein
MTNSTALLTDQEQLRCCADRLLGIATRNGRIREAARESESIRNRALVDRHYLIGCMTPGDVIPTILMTALPNDRDRTRAQRLGVICYLAKPVKDDELFECAHSAIESGWTISGRVSDE